MRIIRANLHGRAGTGRSPRWLSKIRVILWENRANARVLDLGMASYKIGEVAELLGVSVDSVRRLADSGRLTTIRTAGGQRVVDGRALARFMAAAPVDVK